MIILASKSPRRKELLELMGLEFKVMVSQADEDDLKVDSADVDETLPQNIKPDKAVEYLSKIKAEPFRSSDNIVIGADTVVAIGDKILGKPKDKHDAFLMLKSLSGKEHSVFTGVTIIKNDKTETFSVQTKVKFFELSNFSLDFVIIVVFSSPSFPCSLFIFSSFGTLSCPWESFDICLFSTSYSKVSVALVKVSLFKDVAYT